MASYRLLIKPSAGKELEAVPAKDRSRLVSKIQRLSVNPRPAGSEKLSGEPKYRVRQGDYRVVCSIDDSTSIVMVVKIGHRREVNRN